MAITFTQKAKLEGHEGPVTTLALFKNSNRIISGSRDQTVKLWDLDEAKLIKNFTGHDFFVGEIDISENEKLAASAAWDSSVIIWNLETLEEESRFKEHENDVLTVRFIPKKNYLISGGRDNSIKFFKPTGENSTNFSVSSPSHWITCIRFNPVNENQVIFSSWDKKVTITNINDSSKSDELIGHGSFIECLDISSDGSLCISGARDGMVLFWDLKLLKYLQFVDVNEHVKNLKIDSNNSWVYILSASKLTIYDLGTKEIIHELKPPQVENAEEENEMLSFTLSKDSLTLYTGCTDGCIYVWELTK
ncbi:G-protein beta subunit [Neoconidiobolus thromboides FSU 785]|nr:G-protein beta subunit [Neoconidiobolus thromboides FSU 785]